MKETIYNINGSGGAFVSIPVTIPCRQMEIVECQLNDATPFAPQGLDYQRDQDAFASTHLLQPGEIMPYWNPVTQGIGSMPIIGWPAQQIGGASPAVALTTAHVAFKLRSSTATATYVRVREWE